MTTGIPRLKRLCSVCGRLANSEPTQYNDATQWKHGDGVIHTLFSNHSTAYGFPKLAKAAGGAR